MNREGYFNFTERLLYMKPTRNEMQGDWLNEDNRLVITFDTLPFDDYNIAHVVSNEVKKSGKKFKVKDKVLYGGMYFLHENKLDQFIIAIGNQTDDKTIEIQANDYDANSFKALIQGYGELKFIRKGMSPSQ